MTSSRGRTTLSAGKMAEHRSKGKKPSRNGDNDILPEDLRGLSSRVLVKDALLRLQGLVLDGSKEVQQAAFRAIGNLLAERFSEVYPLLFPWVESDEPRVRRAVAVAIWMAARPQRYDMAEPLLKLVELLLPDREDEVRWQVGPKAIAKGLLIHYPDDTFEYLMKWSTSHDEQVLWNVAMGLSGAAQVGLTSKALIILRRLALDERRYVWRAVASAMWRLGRRTPERVLAELRLWLSDEDRAHVARVALRHI